MSTFVWLSTIYVLFQQASNQPTEQCYFLLFTVDDKSVQAHLNPKQKSCKRLITISELDHTRWFFFLFAGSENDLDTLANHEHLLFLFTYLVSREWRIFMQKYLVFLQCKNANLFISCEQLSFYSHQKCTKMSGFNGSIILTVNCSLQLGFPLHTSYTKFY